MLFDFLNQNPDSSLRSVLDESTCTRILTILTDRIYDSAVVVRKNALTTYSSCVMNQTMQHYLNSDDLLQILSNLLQDSAGFSSIRSSIRIVSVRRSALALYYRVLDSSPHLLHLFFSVSLSMFENTSNTDLLITKNVQKHVFDTIIAWRTSHSSLSGWICLEFLNPGSISVFEVFALLLSHAQTIMKLLIDRNSLHLGSLMHSCISAIEWCQSSQIPEPELISMQEKVPHLEENAWMLLSLLSKVRSEDWL